MWSVKVWPKMSLDAGGRVLGFLVNSIWSWDTCKSDNVAGVAWQDEDEVANERRATAPSEGSWSCAERLLRSAEAEVLMARRIVVYSVLYS